MTNAVGKEIKKHPKRSILTSVLLFTLLIALIEALRLQIWVSVLTIVVISALIFLPMIIGKWSKIDIPIVLEIFSVLFIYATLFLGELKNYYVKFWWWDILVHTSSALMFGLIGFIILYVLYKTGKIKTNPKTIAMFAFAFALSIGALWEIVEFSMDRYIGTTMQGNSLKDTMLDLIVDSLGALFSAVMGYLYLKNESGIVVKPVVKEFKKDNPKFFPKKKSK